MMTVFSLISFGLGECVDDIEVELWGECYNIEETANLSLSNSGLTGGIPPEIGNLTNLTGINLSDNQLTSIPESIDNLSNLISLNLENTNLTTIPESIGNLSSLQSLKLMSNQLTSL